MIHMGSDHCCVMATFVIHAQKKNFSRDANDNKQIMTTMENISAQIDQKKVTKKYSRSKKDTKNSKKRSNKKPQPQNQI